jgi:hypothetical protein
MSLKTVFSSFKNTLFPVSAASDPASGAADPASEQTSISLPVNSDPVLMQALADVLLLEEIAFEWRAPRLLLAGGLLLGAEAIESKALASDRVRTCTRIEVSHPVYFPQGIAEFQHAMGASEALSIAEGFRAWIKMDLVALLDATREVPKECTVIEMSVVAETATDGIAGSTAHFRQVILGPIGHLATLAAPEPKEEHPFCPCCLFTESTAAFHELLQTNRFLGVRLFVSRDSTGQLAADCRVNGVDFAPAAELLSAYASTWPERGLEFRKQYVVIRSVTRPAGKVAK